MANSRRDRYFKESFPIPSIKSDDNDLASRSKFNFSYFVGTPPGQEFKEWSHSNIVSLLEKLKEFSRYPLQHWRHQSMGKSGSVLAIYGDFPSNSGFTVPKHTPQEAQWGRFRLDWSSRLVGFIVPHNFHDEMHKCGKRFDANTFYVVFLDENHEFYKSESK